MKNLIDEQTSSNVAQKKIDSLEQEARQLRQECERTKADLLAELKQTRAEKQTFEMMAQRLSEKQTKQRMQQQPQTDDKQPIGNFIGKGGSFRNFDQVGEELGVQEVDILDDVPKRIGDETVTLNQSVSIQMMPEQLLAFSLLLLLSILCM
jgi:hypothetical protein